MIQPINPASPSHLALTGNNRRFAGKRVAMVTFSPYPNDPRPRRAIDALVGEGASVDLICLWNEGSPKREALNGINVLRLPIKHDRRGKFAYAYRYGAFILTSSVIFALRTLGQRYDLVYVHNMPDILVLSSLIPKALGAKVVLDLHDPMPELMMTIFDAAQGSTSVQFLERLEKWSIARADLVITVNVACKRIFSSRSCRPEKIAVVMNSPDGQIFPFRATPSEGFTGKTENKPFVIMYHGSIVERNGLDVAIDALSRVREAIPTAELRIFGVSTAFLEHMMEAVQKRNLHQSVRYLGSRRLEDLVTEIENCDLGVIPNHQNAFTEINTPTRIFEYLALGKPVVAPSTTGIQDYFGKESLLFFEAGNPGDLAQQIEYAFSYPREVQEIVRRGQQVFLEHSWDRERETLLGRVSEILNKV
ncbi:MAG: glycosyltransferase family 4 protein [Halobacteriota archaeon]|jgi:glycosyltransferase involved in cell wall biosynthesis